MAIREVWVELWAGMGAAPAPWTTAAVANYQLPKCNWRNHWNLMRSAIR